jgi:polysaccharide export outer membrane protein
MKGTAQIYWVRVIPTLLPTIAIVIFSAAAFCVFAAPQNQRPPGVAASEKGEGPQLLQERNARYQLCKGDTFDLAFPFTAEFNQTVTVQPDGYITLTGLGDLYVAGKTIPEMRELLQTQYGKILHDPVINVVMKDYEKPYFIASGEVARPGKYDMRADTTLTEAIAVAGGFTQSAKHSQVLLFRRVANNWVELKRLDIKQMFRAANLSEDLHLQPGDMFFVPQNGISKFGKYIPNPGIGMTLTRY